MNELSGKIGFIGAGNMASALINGLVNSNHDPKKIIASSPEEEHLLKLSSGLGVKTTQDNLSVVKTSDIVILAIKPNIIEAVLSEIKEEVKKKDILILSIAAGVKMAKIESILGNTTRIFRAMPNTPASIMMGVTAISGNKSASSEDREKAKLLFECVGKVTEVKEDEIDIFTALIGSGPAYVFYLIESLLSSSSKFSLPEEEKVKLISSMIEGAAKLVSISEDSPEILRNKVTSPGGVTQKAIEEFEKHKLKQIIEKSMESAEKRSVELGK